jgi:hypothetical protein
MEKFKLISWKTLSFILSLFLIPFIVNIIANYSTRDNVQISLKLNGWIMLGNMPEMELQTFQFLYKNKPIKRALKISWKIINTGSKGIGSFEQMPAIIYPKKLIISDAFISNESPLLKIDKTLTIDSLNNQIIIRSMGIFNPNDFFDIDVYLIQFPDSLNVLNNLNEWDITAKSIDLKTNKKITIIDEHNSIKWTFKYFVQTIIPIALLYTFFMSIVEFYLIPKIVHKKKQRKK